MNFPAEMAGYKRITSSGVIGASGKPVIVSGYSVLSGAGGVGVPVFIDGSSTAGNLVFNADPSGGAANKERVMTLPVPVMFPNGCYVSFDANTTGVTTFYSMGA